MHVCIGAALTALFKPSETWRHEQYSTTQLHQGAFSAGSPGGLSLMAYSELLVQFVIKEGRVSAVDWGFNVYGGSQKEDGSWVSKWGSMYATKLKDARCSLQCKIHTLSHAKSLTWPASPDSSHTCQLCSVSRAYSACAWHSAIKSKL